MIDRGMPLSQEQIALMKDPKLRKLLPQFVGIFNSFDQLIKGTGSGCGRLPARFRILMEEVKRVPEAVKYIKHQYPSVVINVQTTTKAQSSAQPPPTTMTQSRYDIVAGSVSRAIQLLEERKRKNG